MELSLDEVKYSANIENVLVVMRNLQSQCTGKLQGYIPEKQSIWLTDVSWLDNEGEIVPQLHYESLFIKLDSIANIRQIENKTEDSKSELVKFCNEQNTELPITKLQNQQTSDILTVNWIAGNKAPLTKNTATQMQQFCKKLFTSCNFARLVQQSPQGNQKKFYVNLPSYFAGFFRQPKLYFGDYQIVPQLNDGNERGSQNQNLVNNMDTSLVPNIETSTIASSNHADNSKCLDLELCSQLETLNFNTNDYDSKSFETIEVDLSKFSFDNPTPEVKIGNLIFKTYAQALIDGPLSEE